MSTQRAPSEDWNYSASQQGTIYQKRVVPNRPFLQRPQGNHRCQHLVIRCPASRTVRQNAPAVEGTHFLASCYSSPSKLIQTHYLLELHTEVFTKWSNMSGICLVIICQRVKRVEWETKQDPLITMTEIACPISLSIFVYVLYFHNRRVI